MRTIKTLSIAAVLAVLTTWTAAVPPAEMPPTTTEGDRVQPLGPNDFVDISLWPNAIEAPAPELQDGLCVSDPAPDEPVCVFEVVPCIDALEPVAGPFTSFGEAEEVAVDLNFWCEIELGELSFDDPWGGDQGLFCLVTPRDEQDCRFDVARCGEPALPHDWIEIDQPFTDATVAELIADMLNQHCEAQKDLSSTVCLRFEVSSCRYELTACPDGGFSLDDLYIPLDVVDRLTAELLQLQFICERDSGHTPRVLRLAA